MRGDWRGTKLLVYCDSVQLLSTVSAPLPLPLMVRMGWGGSVWARSEVEDSANAARRMNQREQGLLAGAASKSGSSPFP